MQYKGLITQGHVRDGSGNHRARTCRRDKHGKVPRSRRREGDGEQQDVAQSTNAAPKDQERRAALVLVRQDCRADGGKEAEDVGWCGEEKGLRTGECAEAGNDGGGEQGKAGRQLCQTDRPGGQKIKEPPACDQDI